MNTTFSIKNFRVFDENGVDVHIAPITILTGCNSSGKSSIVKSILLLDSFLKQAKRDYNNKEDVKLGSYKLDFSTYPINQLGGYDKIVNGKSSDKRITFSYTIYSLLLSKDVTVEFTFNVDKNDALNNGFLESLSLSTEDGTFYSSRKDHDTICNLNLIKEDAIRFMIMEFLIQNYSNGVAESEIRGNITEEELNKQKKTVKDFIGNIGSDRFHDILTFMRYGKRERTISEKCKQALEWTYNNSSFFYIPLVELLKDCPKQSIESQINEKLFSSKKISKQVKEVFDRIVKDFFASDCHTFGEYFLMKEREFMNRFIVRPDDLYFTELFAEANFLISMKNDFKIPQHYLFEDPRNKKVVRTLGEENGQDDFAKRCGIEAESSEDQIERWQNKPIDFPILYEVLMEINKAYTDDKESIYYQHLNSDLSIDDSYNHYAFTALGIFMEDLILESIFPEWVAKVSYVSSSRIDVKRLYPLDDTSDFTRLLHRYFEGKRHYNAKAHAEAVLGPFDNKNYALDRLTQVDVHNDTKVKQPMPVRLPLHPSGVQRMIPYAPTALILPRAVAQQWQTFCHDTR